MQTLIDQLKQLRLDGFVENLENLLDQHSQARESILETLSKLTEIELQNRHARTVSYRIRDARFYQIKTVEQFDFNYNPSTRKAKNRYLKLLEADWVSQGLCVLFVGNSGLGKTHLARALGYHLCQKGKRVLNTTLSEMSVELKAADATGRLKKAIDSYVKPSVLILDEVGYTTLGEAESNLVFQIISPRYDKGRSTMVTANRPFGEWNQIFSGDAIAHAILDRLVQRSEVFYLEGRSYRETHREHLKV